MRSPRLQQRPVGHNTVLYDSQQQHHTRIPHTPRKTTKTKCKKKKKKVGSCSAAEIGSSYLAGISGLSVLRSPFQSRHRADRK